MPRGMLCVPAGTAGLNSVQVLHSQWGAHPIYGAQLAESVARVARAPGPASSMTCTVPRPGSIRCVYRGLTDGQRVFPNDTLTIDAVADQKTGQIEISASAQSAADDVVGVMVPLVNLSPGHAVYVPSFGGMRYAPAELASKRLFSLDRAPFVEAPVLVAEGNAGSVGLWVEDASFAPFHTLLRRRRHRERARHRGRQLHAARRRTQHAAREMAHRGVPRRLDLRARAVPRLVHADLRHRDRAPRCGALAARHRGHRRPPAPGWHDPRSPRQDGQPCERPHPRVAPSGRVVRHHAARLDAGELVPLARPGRPCARLQGHGLCELALRQLRLSGLCP
jgi:hypothetical protein